ncbi:MAG: polysaccharide biosynthesis/export family protein [Sphingomonas bacterium]
MIAGLAGASLAQAPMALAQAAPAAQAAPPAQLRPYRIGPGDELEVYVWGEERLQRSIKVLPDGTFSFPLVGQVNANNKLPADVEREISAGLRGQFRDTVPQVTVSVKTPAGVQFSVAGKVKAPGAFATGRYINVLEALALAGGPADFADVGNIRILHKSGNGLVVIRVRLTDILKGNPSERDLAGLPQIETGDTVVVP